MLESPIKPPSFNRGAIVHCGTRNPCHSGKHHEALVIGAQMTAVMGCGRQSTETVARLIKSSNLLRVSTPDSINTSSMKSKGRLG